MVRLTRDDQWDLFGARGVMEALRVGFADVGSPRVVAAMNTVRRLCTPAAYESAATRGRLIHHLQRLFDSLHNSAPVVVLFDSLGAASVKVVNAATVASRAGCAVVIACDDEGVARELTSFGEAASHVVELGALCDQHVAELVADSTACRPDPALACQLRAALGSLAGNPGAVLSLCDVLIDRGRLTQLGGALCLVDPDAPIELPAGHWLVRRVDGVGDIGRQLLALIADSESFALDDLGIFAAAAGHEPRACGHTVDDFTAIGALRCTPDGILAIDCPALGASAIAMAGADWLRAMHLAFAQHLESRSQSLDHVPAALADHLAASKSIVAGRLDADTLLCAARRIQPLDPTSAARWRLAAFGHCEPADRSELLTELLRALVRIGRYDWLAQVSAEAADACDALSAATCLAALHTGTPPDAEHSGALAMPIVDRWFGRNRTFDVEELSRILGPLRDADGSPPSATRGAWFDPIGMFEAALGSTYGVPEAGPLMLNRRIVRRYRRGQWDDALSDVRTLLATYRANTPVHETARLLAVEMSARRGELDFAESWLTEARQSNAFPTIRGWVELGLLWHAGPTDTALEYGWQAYSSAVRAAEAGDSVGLHQLVIRHALLIATCGDGQGLREIHRTVRSWGGRFDGAEFDVMELLVAALALHSLPAARAAAAVLRAQGYQVELAVACLVAARVADDPSPWLRAAEDSAKQIGDVWLMSCIRSYFKRSGVAPQRRAISARSGVDIAERIVELIQQGLTNKQIAAAVQLSEKSVERHISRLFANTGCRSRLDLVAMYERERAGRVASAAS